MTFRNITQQQLNDASYDDLAWLMEGVFNTYKVKECSWDKADKDYLKERCEKWQISPKGKTDVLVERLQQAQLAYELEQGPTVEDIEAARKLNKEMDKKIAKAKANLAKVEKPAKKSSKKTLTKKDKGPTVAELKEEAKELGIKGLTKMKKDDIIEAIDKAKAEAEDEAQNEESDSDTEEDEEGEEDTVVLGPMDSKENEESDDEEDEEDGERDDEDDEEEWVKGKDPNSWVKPSTGQIVWNEEKPE